MCARQPPGRRAGLPGAAPVAGALFVLLLACAVPARADEYDHKYAVGDRVILWENKVGPYNNPQETYNYHELPFCRVETATDEKPTHKWGGLGEILQGNELIDSGVEFKFRVDQPKTTLCVDVLTQKSAKVFKRAVRKHYWYEFVMDDLPIWGFVGENVEGAADGVDATEVRDDAHIAADAAENDLSADDSGVLRGGRHEKKPSPHGKVSSDMLGHALRDKRHGGALGKRRDDKTQALIYTHKRFDVSFNGDRVVSVNLVAENPKPLVAGASLEFTYSVTWLPSETPFRKRFERYLDYNFFEHQIHWFSIFNSFMMVIFLAGLVSMILMRTLRNDYAKYAQHSADDVEDRGGDEQESGWKLVHGDVFRAPRHLPTLAALLGTGTQMALLVLFVILITIFGAAYEGRGTIITVFIVCYALTSFVSGYVSGGFNARNSGKRWIKTMLLTAGLFPGACFGVAFFLNTVAIFYHSLAAVPFGTMVVIFFMWSFISFPLVLFGTVVGRNWNGVPGHAVPREDHPATDPGLAVVPKAVRRRVSQRRAAVRVDLHRDVLRVHEHMELQGVLRVRLFLTRVPHLDDRHAVRHDRGHVLPVKRGEPQVAVDGVLRRRVGERVRLRVQRVLLSLQDEDDGLLPDVLLLRVHSDVLLSAGGDVRRHRVRGLQRVRAEDLQERQGGLAGATVRKRGFRDFLTGPEPPFEKTISLTEKYRPDEPRARESPHRFAAPARVAASTALAKTPSTSCFAPGGSGNGIPRVPGSIPTERDAAAADVAASSAAAANPANSDTRASTNARVSSNPGLVSPTMNSSHAPYRAATAARSAYQPALANAAARGEGETEPAFSRGLFSLRARDVGGGCRVRLVRRGARGVGRSLLLLRWDGVLETGRHRRARRAAQSYAVRAHGAHELVREERDARRRRGCVLRRRLERERGGPRFNHRLEHLEAPLDGRREALAGGQRIERLLRLHHDPHGKPRVAVLAEVVYQRAGAAANGADDGAAVPEVVGGGAERRFRPAVLGDAFRRSREETLGERAGSVSVFVFSLLRLHAESF
jgi:transmembrane 9 superfamily protein 3